MIRIERDKVHDLYQLVTCPKILHHFPATPEEVAKLQNPISPGINFPPGWLWDQRMSL
jgi:hypothetical protein